MKTTALKLIQGDYTAQTQIKQKDEIETLEGNFEDLYIYRASRYRQGIPGMEIPAYD